MEIKRIRRKYSAEEISGILSRFASSGKKHFAFCREEKIHPSTLRNWLGAGKKIKKKRLSTLPSSFVALKVSGAVQAHAPFMELSYPNGRSISFYAEPRAEFLKSLLAQP
jgi:hypothetical protein